jgi:glutathione peroxidase
LRHYKTETLNFNFQSQFKMTIRQRLLKLVYPLIAKFSPMKKVMESPQAKALPPVSFYSLSATANNGENIVFEKYRGKKVLLVNTASDCGYTGQYAALQQLHERWGDKVEVIGFPANNFKEQEKGTDADIAQFCQVNYGVSFQLFKKKDVIGDERQPVYQWLADAAQNGWNTQEPEWNFAKYIIDEEGRLLRYIAPGVSPLAPEVLEVIGV